jgi:hypothetical protein
MTTRHEQLQKCGNTNTTSFYNTSERSIADSTRQQQQQQQQHHARNVPNKRYKSLAIRYCLFCQNVTTVFFIFFINSLFLNLQRHCVHVQEQIGVTLCACQPTTYTFNFTLTCNDQNLTAITGVLQDNCFIGSFTENIWDTVPVAVSLLQVLEMDGNMQVLAYTSVTGDFWSTYSFTYTSILSRPAESIQDPDTIPRGLQLVIRGRNQLYQFVDNTWIVLYNNDCGMRVLLPIILALSRAAYGNPLLLAWRLSVFNLLLSSSHMHNSSATPSGSESLQKVPEPPSTTYRHCRWSS